MEQRWIEWTDRHQHLPLSMALLGCSSFYEGKWAGSEKAFEHAVGQEFARALLVVLWPDAYQNVEWVRWDKEHDFREILANDLATAPTQREKDELTLGMFSKLNNETEFRQEVKRYAASARGKAEVVNDDNDKDNPSPRASSFPLLWTFPLLYEWSCHLFFFAPIHQQLVESVFSKYDTCTKPCDSREIDIVCLGQFSSAQSRKIQRAHASNSEIRQAGAKAIKVARELSKAASTAVPCERQLRKRSHDVTAFLKGVNDDARFGSEWLFAGIAEESESEKSAKSDDLSESSGDDE
ncbi:unnamed protein product [Pylaiella littoralis]